MPDLHHLAIFHAQPGRVGPAGAVADAERVSAADAAIRYGQRSLYVAFTTSGPDAGDVDGLVRMESGAVAWEYAAIFGLWPGRNQAWSLFRSGGVWHFHGFYALEDHLDPDLRTANVAQQLHGFPIHAFDQAFHLATILERQPNPVLDAGG